MKEFNGTKGPWFEHREGSSTVYVEAKLRDGVIQEVAACGPTEAGREAQYANARLIAAAPDLLEALQEIIQGLEMTIRAGHDIIIELGGQCDDAELIIKSDSELKKAYAAIAKALGE